MRQSEIYARVIEQWSRDNPGERWIFTDAERPASWYRGYPAYVSFTELLRELHVGYANLLRILAAEKVAVIRVARGMGHCCYIFRLDLPKLKSLYGNHLARERRWSRWGSARFALQFRCPHCGKKGRQWRNDVTTAGNQKVFCGHCRGRYTMSLNTVRLPPLRSPCPNCGADTKQWRQRLTSAGNRIVLCAHCRKYYTIPNEDPPKPQRTTPDNPLAPANPDEPVLWKPIFERIEW